MEKERFSVIILEKDVLEYVHYKNKYEKYKNIKKSCRGKLFPHYYDDKLMYFYNKYIAKLKYLEENYRKTFIYTKYHEQLENDNLLDQTTVVATLIEPSAPNVDIIYDEL